MSLPNTAAAVRTDTVAIRAARAGDCNFQRRRGLYKYVWKLHLTGFVLLVASQIAATYSVDAMARTTSERSTGADATFSNLRLMRGHPYAWVLADLDMRSTHGSAHVQFNTGRLYPVKPIDNAGTLDYRNLYFLPQAYGGVTWNTGAVDMGRQRVVAAGGRVAAADVPALRWAGTWGTWGADAALAKLETFEWLDTDRTSAWAQARVHRSIGWWDFAAGSHVFWDDDGRMADLYNPFWPLVALSSEACRDRRGRCFLALQEADGFLQTTNTKLSSSWLEADGYAGPLALQARAVVQAGRSHFVPLAAGFPNAAPFSVRHRAWALDAAATWVGARHEVGLNVVALSGDDGIPTRALGTAARSGSATIDTFIGVGSYWTDTLLFFGNGLNAGFTTAEIQPAGRLGFGVVGIIPGYRFFGDWFHAWLQVAPLWALHAIPTPAQDGERRGRARRYGIEFDTRLRFLPTQWLAVEVEGAILAAPAFPVIVFDELGVPRLADPDPLGYVALVLEITWEQAWTSTR